MPSSISEWFSEQAARRADRPALTTAEQRWTYEELHRDVERVAGSLRDLGVHEGDRVAMFCRNHPATIITFLAAARIGAVPSPINFMFPEPELAWVLGRLGAKVLVTDAEHLDTAVASVAAAGLDILLFSVDGASGRARAWSELTAGEERPGGLGEYPGLDDDFEIIFTSGTTGNPKGARFDHRSILYQLESWRDYFGHTPDETWYVTTPLFHSSGMRYGALVALLTGGHVVLPTGFHPTTFWQEIVEHDVTFFVIVETMGLILLQLSPSDEERSHKVRRILTAGHRDLLRQMEERFGLVTVQGYGMSEIGVVLATEPFGDPAVEQARRDWNPGWNYVGFPTGPRTEVRVVDEHLRDVPDGELGEIAVRSPGNMQGYIGDTDGGREIADGWLRTGDVGARSPEGAVYYADRSKDMIRRGGENIASKQVEEALEAHPDILEVAVYPVPDPIRMQEVKALCVAKGGADLSADDVWAWCASRLADFKVPRYLEFRDAVPRNPLGRALKARLRDEPIAGQGATYDRTTGALVEQAS